MRKFYNRYFRFPRPYFRFRAGVSLLGVWALHLSAAGAAAGAIDLPFDGTWKIREKLVNDDDFFADTFEWTLALPVLFVVTDLYAVDDEFENFDLNLLRLISPFSADWDNTARSGPFKEEPFDPDPVGDLREEIFCSAEFFFGSRKHRLRIRGIELPNRGSPSPLTSHIIPFSALSILRGAYPSTIGVSPAARA